MSYTHLPDLSAQVMAHYPSLASVAMQLDQPGLVQELPNMAVASGTTLFRENDPCTGFPLVLEGEVRVSKTTANGRELELYRVVPGEMCLVSSASLFNGMALTARGITTQATRLALLPAPLFKRALQAEPFRDYVLGLFATRMAELTSLIEAVAFQRLDSRLAATLLGHGTQVVTTHQKLADELGTVREIVTRLLHRFERSGWVELSRECITIKNSVALRATASGVPPQPPAA